MVLPLVLAVNASMLLRTGLRLRETGIVIASCVAGSAEVLLFGTHEVNHDVGAQLAIVAVLVFTNSVMRVRLPFATIVFGWGLCAEWFLLRHSPGDKLHIHALSSVMALSIGVLTLTANYGQDREARLAFLKWAEKQELVGTLAQSNEQLAAAALTDSLTGLANRSAMDAYLAKVWSEPKLKELPCSVIMVDIDHFKSLNDRYGHLYGDRVLKRVAHLLAEALRGENDFIARFGGEEFVVILPQTPAHLACIVAERLRGLVEMAGLPPTRAGDPSLQGLRATISCGVATTLPSHHTDPYVLIGAADEALYCAKRDGRNIVRGTTGAEDLTSAVSTIVNDVLDQRAERR